MVGSTLGSQIGENWSFRPQIFGGSMKTPIGHNHFQNNLLWQFRENRFRGVEKSVDRKKVNKLEMWANAQRDGRPAEHRWRPLFNAAKFG